LNISFTLIDSRLNPFLNLTGQRKWHSRRRSREATSTEAHDEPFASFVGKRSGAKGLGDVAGWRP
jgi:hypothetical protein